MTRTTRTTRTRTDRLEIVRQPVRFALPVFPGSNCDHDVAHVLGTVLGQHVDVLWHDARSLRRADVVVVPGGFSYGDYLRCGAIARFSPVMKPIAAHARAGKPVIGICNGFQILCEAGLLPGALVRNLSLSFVCSFVRVRVEATDTPFTCALGRGRVLRMPIAHGEGRYVADDRLLRTLRRERRIVFRYCDADGETAPEANPNGSADAIAGICNERRNVVGMMPHPERASESAMGSTDGRLLFESVLAWARTRRR